MLLDAIHSAIDRADAKAGAVVAACGVSAAALTTVCGAHRVGAAAIVCALLCAALMLASVSCAGLALRPRRMRAASLSSLVYFDHIARLSHNSAEVYVRDARALFGDAEALTEDILHQVWATSQLATAKYDWLDRAVVLLFAVLLTLGLTVLLLVA